MQIVIDIPENEYIHIREYYEKNDIVEATYSYIYHGTPLPEPHGRLIDIVSEIESQDPADYGRTYQEKAAAENMKRNILEIIKERVKYE